MNVLLCAKNVSLASVLRDILSRQGADAATIAVHRIAPYTMEAYAGMTHQVKNEVMKRVSQADKKAVGAKNPDIAVVSRKDDRIVLIPPRLRANEMKNPKGHTTEIRARDIFGPDWKDMFPIKYSDRIRQVIEQLEITPGGDQYLKDPSSVALVVRTAQEGWKAFIASDACEAGSQLPF